LRQPGCRNINTIFSSRLFVLDEEVNTKRKEILNEKVLFNLAFASVLVAPLLCQQCRFQRGYKHRQSTEGGRTSARPPAQPVYVQPPVVIEEDKRTFNQRSLWQLILFLQSASVKGWQFLL
jgi:hypothetical protein